MPKTQGIAAPTNPLARYVAGSGVNACQRHVEYGCPDGVPPKAYITAGAGYSCSNRSRDLPGFLVDPADSSVPLIQSPDRTSAGRQKARFWPNRYRPQNVAARSINGSHDVGIESAYPDYAVGEDRIVGTRWN